jgi:hypothetical protein
VLGGGRVAGQPHGVDIDVVDGGAVAVGSRILGDMGDRAAEVED